MTPIFFAKPFDFRKWLKKNHEKETELLVGFYKVDSGKLNMTWSQSVDEALCFGWIDGVRKSLDNYSYCIRFTPRRQTSNWSAINIKKMEELIKQGLMQPAGFEAFNNRIEKKLRIYNSERNTGKLTVSLEKKFKANKKAWIFFMQQVPSYQKKFVHWIMSAKQEKTQLSRLEKVIAESEKQKRIWDKNKNNERQQ